MNSERNQALVAIGIRLSGVASPSWKKREAFDIEQVILDAAKQMRDDGRLASLIFSWVHMHAEHVIVEKLRKLLHKNKDEDQQIAVSALAAYAVAQSQHKWKKLILPDAKGKCLFRGKAAESAVKLKGAEPWAKEYGILIAEGSVRIRTEDVLSGEDLAKANLQYRNRLLFGASWRADIITAIQQGASTATEVMKRVGCSYEPAHRIRREYLIACRN
jgi:hypothetical protein